MLMCAQCSSAISKHPCAGMEIHVVHWCLPGNCMQTEAAHCSLLAESKRLSGLSLPSNRQVYA